MTYIVSGGALNPTQSPNGEMTSASFHGRFAETSRCERLYTPPTKTRKRPNIQLHFSSTDAVSEAGTSTDSSSIFWCRFMSSIILSSRATRFCLLRGVFVLPVVRPRLHLFLWLPKLAT